MEIKKISEGVNFCFQKTSRFKTSVISVNIICPLDEKSSERALLCYLLARTNRAYPDITSMNRKLASLYGAVISPKVSKVGESQVLSLSLVMVDDRFSLDGKAVSEEAIRLLMDCIFSPDITPDGFKEENTEREKRLLIEKIESEKDEKRIYALNRMIEEMCKDERYSIHKYGKKERVAGMYGGILNKVMLKKIELNMEEIECDSLDKTIEELIEENFALINKKNNDFIIDFEKRLELLPDIVNKMIEAMRKKEDITYEYRYKIGRLIDDYSKYQKLL